MNSYFPIFLTIPITWRPALINIKPAAVMFLWSVSKANRGHCLHANSGSTTEIDTHVRSQLFSTSCYSLGIPLRTDRHDWKHLLDMPVVKMLFKLWYWSIQSPFCFCLIGDKYYQSFIILRQNFPLSLSLCYFLFLSIFTFCPSTFLNLNLICLSPRSANLTCLCLGSLYHVHLSSLIFLFYHYKLCTSLYNPRLLLSCQQQRFCLIWQSNHESSINNNLFTWTGDTQWLIKKHTLLSWIDIRIALYKSCKSCQNWYLLPKFDFF